MTRDDIIRMALEAGFEEYEWSSLSGDSELDQTLQVGEYPVGEAVFKFAALVAAAEREKVARWQIGSGYTTGHGDTIEDLLTELEWQVRESEREACAAMCEQLGIEGYGTLAIAAAIRQRGSK